MPFITKLTGPPCLAIIAMTNVAGQIRRVFLLAMVCTGAALGQSVWWFLNSLGPEAAVTLLCFKAACLAGYIVWLMAENRRRRRYIARRGFSGEESAHLRIIGEDEDMTDIENVHFEYHY